MNSKSLINRREKKYKLDCHPSCFVSSYINSGCCDLVFKNLAGAPQTNNKPQFSNDRKKVDLVAANNKGYMYHTKGVG